MSEPTELEQTIVPYCADQVSDAERRRVEAEMARDPELARTVEAYQHTLQTIEARMRMPAPSALDGLEGRIYREIVARRTLEESRRHRRISWDALFHGGLVRGFGGLWVSATTMAAAALIVGVYLSARAPAPTLYAPVASIRSVSSMRGELLPGSQHDRFRQLELERSLNEAQLMQYGRGDATAAAAMYRRLRSLEAPSAESWVSSVAQAELTNIYRTASIRTPSSDPQALFMDGLSR